jgi:hypothetical protein
MQVLKSPQKCERPPFWNGFSYSIKNYSTEVIFNGMTSLLNFIKIYQLVQKLIGQTHRQEGDLISLQFSFRNESKLKNLYIFTECTPQQTHENAFSNVYSLSVVLVP